MQRQGSLDIHTYKPVVLEWSQVLLVPTSQCPPSKSYKKPGLRVPSQHYFILPPRLILLGRSRLRVSIGTCRLFRVVRKRPARRYISTHVIVPVHGMAHRSTLRFLFRRIVMMNLSGKALSTRSWVKMCAFVAIRRCLRTLSFHWRSESPLPTF